MKQTNNAIKFLMAQYRAIFQNAYFKGLATAALVTVAMAAGQAQAAEGDLEKALQSGTSAAPVLEITVTDAQTVDQLSGDQGYVENLTIASGGNFTFAQSGDSGSVTKNLQIGNTLKVEKGGTLTINNISNKTDGHIGIIGTTAADHNFDDATTTFEVDGGTVSGSKTHLQFNKVILTDATVTLGTNADTNDDSVWSDNTGISVIQNAQAGTGVLEVNGKSDIKLNSGSVITANVANLNGGTITMSGTATSGQSAILRAHGGGSINLLGADITSKGSGDFIVANNIVINNAESVLTLESGSDLTVGGKLAWATAPGSMESGNGSLTLTEGKIDVQKDGTLNIKTGEFNANGGTIVNSGTVNIYAPKVNLSADNFNALTSGTKVEFKESSVANVAGDLDLTKKVLSGDGALASTFVISGDKTLTLSSDGAVTLGTAYKADKLNVEAKTLTLGSGDFTHSSGSITVSDSFVGGGQKYIISGGTLNLNTTANGTVTKVTGFEVGTAADSKLNVDGAWDFGNATLTAKSGGTATFTKAPISNIGKIDVKKDGTVKLKDQSVLVGTDLAVASGGSFKLDNSTAQFTGAVTTKESGSKVELANNSKIQFKYAEATKSGSNNEGLGKLTLDGTSTLTLVDFGKTEITLADLNKEKEKFFSGAGLFDLAGVKVTETGVAEDGTIAYDKAQSGAGIADIYENATVTGVSGNVANSNDWGAAQLASGNNSLTLDSGAALTLNGVNGNLVTQADGKTAAGVTLDSGSTLSVQSNGGTLETITTGKANEGKVLVGADLVVNKDIGASGSSVSELSVQKAGNTQVQNVYANVLNVDGKLEVAKNVNLSGASTVNGFLSAQDITSSTGTLDVQGQVEAKNISVSGDVSIGGYVVAESLKLTSAAQVKVGDADSSGLLDLGSLDLNSGSLLIDPSFDLDASVVAIKDVTNTTQDIVSVNGDIGVGMNSVLGIGLDAASAKELVTNLGYLQNGKLQKDGVGAVLVVDNTLSIASGDNVIIDPTKDHAGLSAAISGASGDTLTLAKGAGLVITDNMTTQSAAGTAVISFVSGSGSFTAESGSVIAFDKALTAADNVQLTNAQNVTTTGATISAANGLLVGTSDNKGNITFALDTKAADRLYNQSTPIKDFTLSAIKGDFNANRAEAGVDYVLLTSGLNGGQAIEATSRLAVYGGSVQATNLAQQAATDAVVDRMSRANPNGSLVFANNAQGGGLWLSPVYKSHESDSFDADGVDYGVDGDLTGLVLGADSTTESGVRVGGYFNFGSADFDGQGIGEQVSSEADYFGFGLYAGMTFGQMSLVADAGFTQVSNDVEQNTGYAKYSTVTADVDSTAVTLGLRGEYKLNVATMDVTPHLGVRYTRLAVDSYDAKSAGKVLATTDVDTMQMFSVPFGVTISKDIAAGSWTIKPVFDLTLTANAGDTDAKLDTTFIGATPVALTSEAFDSFTYGATMGIDAKYGENFSIGLNTNYVGSSNADEFGVMGNVRYMF